MQYTVNGKVIRIPQECVQACSRDGIRFLRSVKDNSRKNEYTTYYLTCLILSPWLAMNELQGKREYPGEGFAYEKRDKKNILHRITLPEAEVRSVCRTVWRFFDQARTAASGNTCPNLVYNWFLIIYYSQTDDLIRVWDASYLDVLYGLLGGKRYVPTDPNLMLRDSR